jgi:hypothetical protein
VLGTAARAHPVLIIFCFLSGPADMWQHRV